jgi:hypothetical protein
MTVNRDHEVVPKEEAHIRASADLRRIPRLIYELLRCTIGPMSWNKDAIQWPYYEYCCSDIRLEDGHD